MQYFHPGKDVITWRELINYESDGKCPIAFVDETTIPIHMIHMIMDYTKRNDNVRAGYTLCLWCNGTGNELMSMYKECPECQGRGYK